MITKTSHQEGVVDRVMTVVAKCEFYHSAIQGVGAAFETVIIVQPHDGGTDVSINSSRSAGKGSLTMTLVLPLNRAATTLVVHLQFLLDSLHKNSTRAKGAYSDRVTITSCGRTCRGSRANR